MQVSEAEEEESSYK